MRSLERASGARGRAADPAAHAAVRPDRRTIPATSRATCPACARTARSTPTPRSGPCSPRRCRATATAPSSCSRCSTRSTRTRTPDERGDLQGRAVRRRGRRLHRARGSVGRGGWTWYTGSASWMYRVGLEAILGFTKRGDTLRRRPAGAGGVAGVQPRVPVRKRGLRGGGRATRTRRAAERRRWCSTDGRSTVSGSSWQTTARGTQSSSDRWGPGTHSE